MNIVKRELRANLKSLIIWSISIFLFVMMATTKFSAYYNNPDMLEILEAMPKAMLDAFSLNSANLTTVSGYISVLAKYFYIMLGVHAVLLGSSIIAKEERDKTAEYLFSLPVKRSKVITGKIIAALISSLIVLIVTYLSTIVSVLKYEPSGEFYKFLSLLMVAIFIVQLVFLAIGMLIASILKQYKKSGSISVSILLGTYMLSVLIAMSGDIDFLKFLTPFAYFEPVDILNESKLGFGYVALSILIVAACIIGTFIFYRKRDLHI